MKLSEALTRIGGGSEKTAATQLTIATGSPAPSSDAADKLRAALKEATAPDPATKTAAQASPIEDLTKIAADISNAEHAALVKEGQLYGAAVCDGFMARAAQYDQAARKHAGEQPAPVMPSTKVAADDGGFDKFASENPDLVKNAMSVGYNATIQQLEKLGEDAYAKGWNEAIGTVYKVACDAFVAGFQGGQEVVEALGR